MDKIECSIISREESRILKGIAILSVIFWHGCLYHAFNDVPVLKNPLISWYFCHGGMSLFLILSGYGLYESYVAKGLVFFWDNKISKIYLHAAFIQCVGVLIALITRKKMAISILEILCISATNHIDGNMWYLSYLLFLYLLFYVFFKFFSQGKLSMCLFMMIYLATMPLMIQTWEFCNYCVISFAIGVLAAKLHTGNAHLVKVWRNNIICFGIAVITGFISVVYYFCFSQNNNIIIDNIGANSLAITWICIARFLVGVRMLAPLNHIGKLSYFIYLLHGKTVLQYPYDQRSSIGRFTIFVLLLVATILLASMYSRIIAPIQTIWKENNDILHDKTIMSRNDLRE